MQPAVKTKYAAMTTGHGRGKLRLVLGPVLSFMALMSFAAEGALAQDQFEPVKSEDIEFLEFLLNRDDTEVYAINAVRNRCSRIERRDDAAYPYGYGDANQSKFRIEGNVVTFNYEQEVERKLIEDYEAELLTHTDTATFSKVLRLSNDLPFVWETLTNKDQCERELVYTDGRRVCAATLPANSARILFANTKVIAEAVLEANGADAGISCVP